MVKVKIKWNVFLIISSSVSTQEVWAICLLFNFGLGFSQILYKLFTQFYQSVVCIVCKAAVRCIGNIACCIIAEGFFRQDRIAQVLYSTFGYTAKTIISITHFGQICKYFFFDNSWQIIIGVLKVSVSGYAICPVGNADEIVVRIVCVPCRIAYGSLCLRLQSRIS